MSIFPSSRLRRRPLNVSCFRSGFRKSQWSSGGTCHPNLQDYSFDFVQANRVTGAVVQFGGTRRFVVGDALGHFQRAAPKKKSRDSRRAKCVAANRCDQSRLFRSPFDHVEHVPTAHASAGEVAGLAQRLKKRDMFARVQAGDLKVGVHVFFRLVERINRVPLLSHLATCHRSEVSLSDQLRQRHVVALAFL